MVIWKLHEISETGKCLIHVSACGTKFDFVTNTCIQTIMFCKEITDCTLLHVKNDDDTYRCINIVPNFHKFPLVIT